MRELPWKWIDPVKMRLNELCKLPHGWDGYRAGPVQFTKADFAFDLLKKLYPFDGPVPQIVPGFNGDLQIEWHLGLYDIELHVLDAYNVHAWRATPVTEVDGEEVELTTDFTAVMEWVSAMMAAQEALIAAQSTAA